jgi:hypothetical protein
MLFESAHIPDSRLLKLASSETESITTTESDHLDDCRQCMDSFRRYCIMIRDKREKAGGN